MAIQLIPAGQEVPAAEDPVEIIEEPLKRGRGRPKGSLNKPKVEEIKEEPEEKKCSVI